ncbi:MAG: phaG [Panacagrimonas sp.]|nr:Na+/H+ antiporter subunit G [Panacagrimonas sp.]MCC2656904.1 phaG [Panacagrimonas sp.]
MSTGVSPVVELVAAGLLVLSGVLVLVSAIGFLRLPDFFLRMHPPALAYTLASWCVAAAAVLYFSALESRMVLRPLLIPVLLAFTVPVTTVLLARATVFRRRKRGAADVPEPLTSASEVAKPEQAER